MNQLDQIVAEIEWSILESGAKEISTVKIGEKIMAALKATDEIAYVRYASVYRRFKDVGELMAEMQQFVN
jgi:transcriptional repressor NrdR